jgi:hypothetical protein
MSYLSLSKGLNRRAIIGVLLIAVLLSQLAFHPVAAATSETAKIQPIYEVTVSNMHGIENGSAVGKLSGLSWITYMTFDLSSIPQDADIQSIKLKVCSSTFTTGNKFVTIHSVSSNWTESTITWDNRPTNDKLLGTEWIELFFEWYTWDFTNWGVKTQNNKLSISMELSMGMDGYLEFYSKNTSSPPYIEIVYTLPDPTPTPTVYTPTDYVISVIVLIGIIAVIGAVGFFVFRIMFPKKPKNSYPPPPPPNN